MHDYISFSELRLDQCTCIPHALPCMISSKQRSSAFTPVPPFIYTLFSHSRSRVHSSLHFFNHLKRTWHKVSTVWVQAVLTPAVHVESAAHAEQAVVPALFAEYVPVLHAAQVASVDDEPAA